ncbi:unnamed protein product [marine sediment metagenome]|uniref:Uncharacterized protein n=1 Tax=marine sediment metagenome TaxID=412755 RepID=X1SD85_9ZZZZ
MKFKVGDYVEVIAVLNEDGTSYFEKLKSGQNSKVIKRLIGCFGKVIEVHEPYFDEAVDSNEYFYRVFVLDRAEEVRELVDNLDSCVWFGKLELKKYEDQEYVEAKYYFSILRDS